MPGFHMLFFPCVHLGRWHVWELIYWIVLKTLRGLIWDWFLILFGFFVFHFLCLKHVRIVITFDESDKSACETSREGTRYFGSSAMESTQWPFISGCNVKEPCPFICSSFWDEKGLNGICHWRHSTNSKIPTWPMLLLSHGSDVITVLCYRRQVSLTSL